MIVAFTGGRNYSNYTLVYSVLKLIKLLDNNVIIRVGDCPTGLDLIVRQIVKDNAQVYIANWTELGNPAGPERNKRMLLSCALNYSKPYEINKADLLVSFPGGNGTANCIYQAKENNIRVVSIP